MDQFIMGAAAMASLVAAVFFLRYWRDTHDRLFFIFSLSFCLLAITRLGLNFVQQDEGYHQHLYLVRFVAFALILFAIWDKNRPGKPVNPPAP